MRELFLLTQLEGQQVRFADGSFAEVDVVIYCTGYALRLPFLSDALLEIKQNGVELYKHVFHPDIPTLAFIGLCNVAGSTFPIVEIQGRWVARVLAGSIHLPSREEMHASIKRYRSHPSHSSPIPMQVQLLEYVEDIAGILRVRPHLWRHLGAAPRWFLGPFTAAHYRLDRPGKKS